MTNATTFKSVEIRLSQASHNVEKSLRSLSALVSGVLARAEADSAVGEACHRAMEPLARAVRVAISAKSELDAARAILVDAGIEPMGLPRRSRPVAAPVRRVA